MTNDFPEYETFQDFQGNNVKFKYMPLDAGYCFSLKAMEIKEDDPIRIFSAYDNESLLHALLKIRKIIRKELNTRYFSDDHNGELGSMNPDYFRGNIGSDDQSRVCLIIDGKAVSLDELGKLLDTHSGFWIEVKFTEE